MKSTKTRKKRMDHNEIILKKKSYSSDWIKTFLWKNQNDDFDQTNKRKLLWRKKMSDFYEEKKTWFHTNLFSDFQNDFNVGSLKLNL